MFLCCPYCLSPIAEEEQVCPTCATELNDALVEMPSPEMYRMQGAKECGFCRAVIHTLASKCPVCRRPQPHQDEEEVEE